MIYNSKYEARVIKFQEENTEYIYDFGLANDFPDRTLRKNVHKYIGP